jgi:hypothetical protein
LSLCLSFSLPAVGWVSSPHHTVYKQWSQTRPWTETSETRNWSKAFLPLIELLKYFVTAMKN